LVTNLRCGCCQVVSTTIQFLTCQQYGPELRVVSEQSIDCSSSSYQGSVALMAILLLIECLIIPALLFRHLCRYRSLVEERDKTFGKLWSILYGVMRCFRSAQQLLILQGYSPRSFYWVCISARWECSFQALCVLPLPRSWWSSVAAQSTL